MRGIGFDGITRRVKLADPNGSEHNVLRAVAPFHEQNRFGTAWESIVGCTRSEDVKSSSSDAMTVDRVLNAASNIATATENARMSSGSATSSHSATGHPSISPRHGCASMSAARAGEAAECASWHV